MNNYRLKMNNLIHNDHSYMTLAAYECLPEKMQQQIGSEAGLLIRWFCELPDLYWELFGKLGEWEINNHFCFDWRRNLKASFFLGCNPVTGRGIRHDHMTDGALIAMPELLSNSVKAMKNSELRHGLAFAGAACHYIQDVVTFPEQQSVHRRAMAGFEDIAIPGYQPKSLFSAEHEIPEALKQLFHGDLKNILSEAALEIRTCMRSGDQAKRSAIQLQCDNLGARLTADILYSVLAFYQPDHHKLLQHVQDFTDIDEERLPDGWFVDRDDTDIFQGYAAVEGYLNRGYDTRRTSGLQLRLSATGCAEIRWKQSIVDALPVEPGHDYSFGYAVYCDELSGENGCRLFFYDDCWEPCECFEFPFAAKSGWEEIEHHIHVPDNVQAVTVDFFSSNNTGTVLVDHWQLKYSKLATAEIVNGGDSCQRLILAPGKDFRLRDLSTFSNRNEPITSLIGGMPGDISDGDEFCFDGKSHFIEIPYHPVYQPLWIEGDLIISLDFWPKEFERGELMMSAKIIEPSTGWRLRLKQHRLVLSLYNSGQAFNHAFDQLTINADQWNTLQCTISPANEFVITLNKQTETGQAPFSRQYSNVGHYIGADFGVANFFNGNIRNLQIRSDV